MIDIIIVNYQSSDFLVRCLRSVYADLEAIPACVYVQDNASQDHIKDAVAEFPRVFLTVNRKNLGFGKAVNQALAMSAGKYVVLLNPDTYVRPGFFKTAIRFMDDNPRVAVMGPRICEENGRLQNTARAFPTPLTALFGRSSLMSRWFPRNPVTTRNLLSLQSDGKSPMRVDWVSGACMVVRREAIQQVGMFDERFFMYWEDADWCRRMWLKRWEVVYFPRPVVVHFVGASSEKLFIRAAYEFHKSSFKLFKKYAGPTHQLVWSLVSVGLYLRFCIVLFSGTVVRWFQGRRSSRGWAWKDSGRSVPERVRVLRLIARLNIGGPAIHAHLLTNGLDRRRFESFLVTGKISPQEGDMSYLFTDGDVLPINVPELQREISLRRDLRSFFLIFKIIRRLNPDIVHTHTAKAGTSARLAVLVYETLSGRKVFKVHTFHGHAFKGYFSRFKSLLFVWIERLLARFTDAVIAISSSQKQELTIQYRIAPAEKVKTIELGFDLQPFLSCEALKGGFRKQIGVDPDIPLIGIIGRLVPIKNHRMFLDAAGIFLKRHPASPVRFVVVGDGELGEELLAYSGQLGLEKRFVFCGWVKQVPTIYADLDILSLTSLNEGTPVSIIEAMAASVPVAATDAGGVRDLLGATVADRSSDGFTICERGLCCRVGDPQGLARAWDHLLAPDNPQNSSRIDCAREFAIKRYSKERLLRDVEQLYESLMSTRERKPMNAFKQDVASTGGVA